MKREEFGAHVAILIVLSGAGLGLWRRNVSVVDPSLEDPVARLVTAACLVTGVVLAGRGRWIRLGRRLRREPLLAVLVAWAMLSAFWSVAPSLTLRRAAAMSLAWVYGGALAEKAGGRGLLRLAAFAALLTVLAGLALALVSPLGRMPAPDHGVSGLFVHRNVFGRMSVIGLASAVGLALARRSVLWAGAVLASLAGVLASGSVTALVVAGAVLPLAFGIVFAVRRVRLAWPGVLVVGVGCAAAFGVMFESLALSATRTLGREPTLTGRTELWSVLLPIARSRIWTGFGLGAFWSPWSLRDAVWQVVGWRPPHAHNGFLDSLLALGLPGLSITILVVVRAAARWLREASFRDLAYSGGWALVLALAAINVTETYLLGYQLPFVLLAALALAASGRVGIPAGSLSVLRGRRGEVITDTRGAIAQ